MMLSISIAALSLASLSLCAQPPTCDTIDDGYTCKPGISHYWGNYSPWFRVHSGISPDVPKNCEVTFVDILARHGARYPLTANSAAFNKTITKIQSTTKTFKGKYAFLTNYVYSLGAESLTPFGQQELINLGIHVFNRYTKLLKKYNPFTRASGVPRIIASAQFFSEAIHNERISHFGSDPFTYPYPILVLSEEPGFNNTLGHGTCTNFESSAPYNQTAIQAQLKFANVFVPPIAARLNADLAPTVLSIAEVIQLMELCPFSTVANPGGAVSPFCGLFTTDEWHSYDYYSTLGKFYAFGGGNVFGSTQGVGFVNELIARLTNGAVVDNTDTNRTLDQDPATFPVGPDHPVFADFSRDFDITSILFALNLYGDFPPLSNTTIQTTADLDGYSAANTVPFAARVFLERMKCQGVKEELVRIIVNGRVVPLVGCGADRLGRCGVTEFVDGLKFARAGGKFADCYI